MEIIVGLILIFVSIIFATLIWLVISNATLGYSPVLGSLALALCCYWFGKLGFRLVLNKPRKGGRLLSDNSLKLGCIFFGVSSILWGIFSIKAIMHGTSKAWLTLILAKLITPILRP
jgi:hypothetical protein